MSHPTVYLISGANRGIGLALVELLAQRDNVHVFAGARSPDSSSALQSVANKYPGQIDLVKLVSADKANNVNAIEQIKKKAGRLDVVIANAGISQAYESTTEAKPENMLDHFNVNALGPLILFQSAWPLLQQSTETPKFVPVSSTAGSITLGSANSGGNYLAYGTSKAALNYITRKLYAENETLIAFPMCPGPVRTDMVAQGFKDEKSGMKEGDFATSMQTTSEAALGIMKEVDDATRDSHDNVFPTLMAGVPDGRLPW